MITKSKVIATELHVVQVSSVTSVSYQTVTSVDLGILPVINAASNNKYKESSQKNAIPYARKSLTRDKSIRIT